MAQSCVIFTKFLSLSKPQFSFLITGTVTMAPIFWIHEAHEDSAQDWLQWMVCSHFPLNLTSLSSPAALLGMGIALPSVVNLYYNSPEVFVYEVRAFRGASRINKAGVTFSANSGVLGSSRPGGSPCTVAM